MWRPSPRVDFRPKTAVGSWHSTGPRAIQKQPALRASTHNAAYSKQKVKELENRSSSDDTDAGACWSDHERVPGTKPGEKGSCRPKKKKEKEESAEKKG
jgi:hypothetical protein